MSQPGAFDQPAPPAEMEYTSTIPMAEAVAEPERIGAIDLARGIALLGIFLVNMQFFTEPFGVAIGIPQAPEGSGVLDVLAYYFVFIFCAGKFYTLFSMLFGIGFIIQLDRAMRAGRRFVPAYLRRLAFLCLLGAAHALLLWYGDILFIYSWAGLMLFAVVMIFKPGARALLWTGCILVIVSTLMGIGINFLMSGGIPDSDSTAAQVDGAAATQPATQPADSTAALADEEAAVTQAATEPAATDKDEAAATQPATEPATAPALTREQVAAIESPSERLFAGFRYGVVGPKGPADPLWLKAEEDAYRDGPYYEALVFRLISFAIMITFTVISGFGLHVLGMFFIGAGLYRAGFFDPGARTWYPRFILVGLLIGLPIVLLAVFGHRMVGRDFLAFMGALNMIGGPLMSLAYLSAAALLAASGALAPLVRAIGRVGRMALTNYLSETLIATFIMYHWGLGWFGSVHPAGQMAIAVLVYCGLILTSAIWLRYFQFGPMEWIWRLVTYWRPQPLLRK